MVASPEPADFELLFGKSGSIQFGLLLFVKLFVDVLIEIHTLIIAQGNPTSRATAPPPETASHSRHYPPGPDWVVGSSRPVDDVDQAEGSGGLWKPEIGRKTVKSGIGTAFGIWAQSDATSRKLQVLQLGNCGWKV